MKLEIEKRDLLNLIGKTQNVVEKRNTMPVLVNVLMDCNQGKLKIFATDLEVSLTDEALAKVQVAGKVAVSAKSLFDIVKELNEGSITLTKKENNWLEIKQGKYTSKLVGISAEEYPVFPVSKTQDYISVESSVLKEMIEKTVYSISNDETRYHLNGVFFEKFFKGNQTAFRMVATDGHRLSVIEKMTEVPANDGQPSSVIIPKKGVFEIRKMLETDSSNVEMAIEGSQLIVRSGSTLLMVRLIEGRYPNYQQLIPQKLTNHVLINRESFLSSLKRVSLLANQKSKGVTLTLAPGRMEISSNNPEMGDAKEEIEIGYKGQEMKIGFNAKYIQDVLSSITDESVDFEINDQLSPGLLRPHNDRSYTCVVMPMRI